MLVKLLNGLLSLISAPESDKGKTLGPLGFRILGEEHTRELTERAEELVQIAFTDLVSKLIKKSVNNFDFEIKNFKQYNFQVKFDLQNVWFFSSNVIGKIGNTKSVLVILVAFATIFAAATLTEGRGHVLTGSLF